VTQYVAVNLTNIVNSAGTATRHHFVKAREFMTNIKGYYYYAAVSVAILVVIIDYHLKRSNEKRTRSQIVLAWLGGLQSYPSTATTTNIKGCYHYAAVLVVILVAIIYWFCNHWERRNNRHTRLQEVRAWLGGLQIAATRHHFVNKAREFMTNIKGCYCYAAVIVVILAVIIYWCYNHWKRSNKTWLG
jgi:ABC-type branched-subunit amino acid transport system permease subunit